MNHGFIKGYRAATDIPPYRFVTYAPDGDAQLATSASDPILGVSDSLGADAGQMADVTRSGIPEVEYAAAIVRGDRLTTDASGKAVVAAAGAPYSAIAEQDGGAGVIGHVWLEAGVVPAGA